MAGVQRRLDLLTQGSWDRGEGPAASFFEYRLNASRSGVLPRHFGRTDVLRCLAGRNVLLIGDSRMRYFFAGLISMLVEEGHLSRRCPRHRSCPFGNDPGSSVEACREFYKGGEGCGQVRGPGDARARLEVLLQARGGVSSRSHLRSRPLPDVVMVANGAWSDAQEPHDTDEDRKRLYSEIDRLVASDPGTLKLLVGYPRCGRKRPWEQHTAAQDLGRKGWAVYNATRLTHRAVWKDVVMGRAWNQQMQPKEALPREAKWDQCHGPHTFDTLLDLEWQVLFNAICQH